MNKHLPGRHNQKTHGRSDPWRGAGLNNTLDEYIAGLKQIPGIKHVTVARAYATSLTNTLIQIDVGSHVDIDLNFDDDLSVNITTDSYLDDALKAGLGGDFFNNLLASIETASQKAGFKQIASSIVHIPLPVAARRGYMLDSINHGPFTATTAGDLAKAAYDYLHQQYGFDRPNATRHVELHDKDPMSRVLVVRHRLYPDVPLYTEYLMERTTHYGAEAFLYDLNFHKDL